MAQMKRPDGRYIPYMFSIKNSKFTLFYGPIFKNLHTAYGDFKAV